MSNKPANVLSINVEIQKQVQWIECLNLERPMCVIFKCDNS